MDTTALKAMMTELAPVIREFVGSSLEPFSQRLEALEAVETSRPEREAADKDANSVIVLRLVQEELDRRPAPQDGKDADLEAVRSIVAEEIGKAATPILGEVDRRVGEAVTKVVAEEVAKIPAPQNGKDADPEEVASLVAEQVERAVAAIPAPQDGKSVGVEDVAPLIAEEVGKAVADLPVPRSIKGVVVDREGKAVFTYSDGSTENIGQVVGRDGTDVDWAVVEVKLRELVDAIPRPKDGKDGFNLEDFDCQPVDERTIKLMFARGEAMHSYELKFPVPLDRGVFREGEEYETGDGVTWGGSWWIAQRATTEKPDGPDSGWRLATKKGRDGKDAK